jgi:hypothetical protein
MRVSIVIRALLPEPMNFIQVKFDCVSLHFASCIFSRGFELLVFDRRQNELLINGKLNMCE